MTDVSYRSLKTVLFVPADKPKYLTSAVNLRPGAVQLDLEDSVAPEHKEHARAQLTQACGRLSQSNILTLVRINNDQYNSPKDLAASLAAGVCTITIPKLETCEQVNRLAESLCELESDYGLEQGSTKLVGLIETVTGLLNRDGWRNASDRLVGLALGSEDLSLDLGCSPTFDNLIDPCRRLLYSAREAKLAVWAYPMSIGNFSDLNKLEHAFTVAKSMGIDGAWCIHPKQVDIAKTIFRIDKSDLQNAKDVVDAFERALRDGDAAVKLNDQMIDLPVYKRAKNILASQR